MAFKNKKYTIILLLAVILSVWSVIIYRMYPVLFPEKEETLQIPETDNLVSSQNEKKRKYTLIASYRDPFLGKIIEPENKKTIQKNKIQNKAKEQITWPLISCNGMILNKSNGSETILLKINGEETSLKMGERTGDLELTRIFKDSVEIKYKTEKRIIKKQS